MRIVFDGNKASALFLPMRGYEPTDVSGVSRSNSVISPHEGL